MPTTGISLVRENTASLRPPRFLWVSFPLGRPLGVPGDATFQRRVLLAALRLLEAEHGPLLQDFPDDVPALSAAEQQGAVCPVPLPPVHDATNDALTQLLMQEISRLEPWYDMAVTTRGRTTADVSGLTPRDAGQFVLRFLTDEMPESYNENMSLGEALKLASEDLKAYYLEAATAQPGAATITSLSKWLWRETALGRVLRTVQPLCLRSADPSVQAIAQRALVPRAHTL